MESDKARGGETGAEPSAPEVDLLIRGVTKRFGDVTAVASADLEVRRGEIVALLGPSGCGKTTLLNLIAGFEVPDEGELRLRGRALNDVPPNRRNTGMVFQHYALFPHMTVADNIAYGLTARRRPRREIDARVAELVSLLKLDGLAERYPAALSGGQRQRVAVARALAIGPEVLLLDEALSALDKQLREEMQIELSLLLRRLGITAILVTHDQREAFAVADRIAVMEAGHIVQVGSPHEVYRRPRSSFVLEFLGSVNTLEGTVVDDERGPRIETRGGLVFAPSEPVEAPAGARVSVYLRAEDIQLSDRPTAVHASDPAEVLLVTFLGSIRRYIVSLGDGQVVFDRPADAADPDLAVGDPAYLDFRPDAAFVLAEPRR